MGRISAYFYFKVLALIFSAIGSQRLELIETEAQYSIWYDSSSGSYCCQIEDVNGIIIHIEKSPTLGIAYIDNEKSVLEVSTIAGSGIRLVKYCDLIGGVVSKQFISPVLAEDGIVVFCEYEDGMSAPKIRIEEMFLSGLLAEQPLYDFAPLADPHLGIMEIAKDGEVVFLTYLSGENFTPKKIEIQLSNAAN
jgi:hypothetical protein